MATTIDNTPSPTQKGAPNCPLMIQFDSLPASSPQRPASRNQSRFERVNQSRFERVNQSRFQRVNQSSHGREVIPATHAESATSPKSIVTKSSTLPPSAPPREDRAKVIVFLVDTHVEIEKGFSPSESATSPKLSRYTLRSVQDRNPERSNASEGSLGLKKGGSSSRFRAPETQEEITDTACCGSPEVKMLSEWLWWSCELRAAVLFSIEIAGGLG
jgi:hypothetical protein